MPKTKIPQEKIDWNDKDQKRAYMQRWRAENKERRKESKRLYQAKHPEYKKSCDARHYQRIKQDSEKLSRRRSRESEQREANRERRAPRIAETKRARYRANPEKFRAAALNDYHKLSEVQRRAIYLERREYLRQYYAAHKEDLAALNKKWREENRDALLRKQRERYARNKVAYIRRANKRRALLTGTYTTADIQRLYETQSGICTGCLKQLNGKYEIDHVMPLALDPTGDRLENLQLLCRPCNRSKHAMHPEIWAARIGKLFV